MALTLNISNAEISSNPATGYILGDAAPGTPPVKGNVTKFSKSFDEVRVDLLTKTGSSKQHFDEHDHDPGSTYPGGPPIGTGGVVAIAADAASSRTIDELAVTGTATDASAIGTAEMIDNSMAKAEVGAPTSRTKTCAASSETSYTHNTGYPLLCHYEVDSDSGESLSMRQTNNAIIIANAAAFDIDNVTVRAYGAVTLT